MAGEIVFRAVRIGENDLRAERVDVLLAVAESEGMTPTMPSPLCVSSYESAEAVAKRVKIARRNMRSYTRGIQNKV